jgi:hypothetical protein
MTAPPANSKSIAALGLKKWMNDLSDLGTIMHAMKKQEWKRKYPGVFGDMACRSVRQNRMFGSLLDLLAERLKKNNQSCSEFASWTAGRATDPPGDHFSKLAAAENLTECYYY